MNAVNSPLNTAERAIIVSCVSGFLSLNDISLNEVERNRIINLIVPNSDARYFHVFTSQVFTDTLFLKKYDFETIDELDSSFLKLGLGNISSDFGYRKISGKENCKQFLTSTVAKLSEHLLTSLSTFKREQLVRILFQNICGIEHERSTWKRTSRAVMGLGRELDDFVAERREYFEKLTATDIACRTLVEMAVCVSGVDGGFEADKSDLSPLMAYVSMIFFLGNLSDGIDKDVVEAHIEIAGNGEIRISHDFQENIMGPLMSEYEKESSIRDAQRYEDFFVTNTVSKSNSGNFSAEFAAAFSGEFKVTLDEIMVFVKGMDEMMDQTDQDIFVIRKDELKAFFSSKELDLEILDRILESFSLEPRPNYSTPPNGFKQRDISPWLFRRRLSLLFKPIVKLNTDDNAHFVIVPEFFFKSFIYLVDTYLNSGMDPERCSSQQMKSWIGSEARLQGMQFNKDVADELAKLGFQTLIEVKISSLLQPNLLKGKNYGDIDVVAWKKGTAALYLIECKDLFFAKTFREIAEQMLEFRGEIRNGKPDRLRRHIERVELLSRNKDKLQTTLAGLLPDFTLNPYVVFSKRVSVLYDKTYKGQVKFSFFAELKESGLTNDSPF